LFWDTYPEDLCMGASGKGAPAKAYVSYQKKIKTTEDHDFAMIALREQMRQDRKVKDNGGKVYSWPMVVTYINSELWDREMKSTQERLEDIPPEFCKCGREDPRYPLNYKKVGGKREYGERVCADCYRKSQEKWNKYLYSILIKIGMGKRKGEEMAEYAERCRSWVRQNKGMGRLVGGG